MTQVRLYQLLPHTGRGAPCPWGKAPVFMLRVTLLPWAQFLPLPGLFSPQPHSLIPTQPPPHLQGLCTCCGLCQTHYLLPTATWSTAPPAQTALPPGSPPSPGDVSSPGQARRAHPLRSHDAGVFSSTELYSPSDKATLGFGEHLACITAPGQPGHRK